LKFELSICLDTVNTNMKPVNGNSNIVILICADAEWEVIAEDIYPDINTTFPSPFGQWFPYDLNVAGANTPVIFFQTGCGKIPAAAATQFVIDKWHPQLIINLGTCGGFKGKVKKGDTLLVTRTVVYDIRERSGHHEEHIAKHTTDLDLTWLKKPYPMDAEPVTMATADQDIDPEMVPRLIEQYGAEAGDWESGAIAYIGHKKNRLKCLIMRGVSDVVDPSKAKPSSEEEIREGTRTVMRNLISGLPQWINAVTI